jgi:hypothetical protein
MKIESGSKSKAKSEGKGDWGLGIRDWGLAEGGRGKAEERRGEREKILLWTIPNLPPLLVSLSP